MGSLVAFITESNLIEGIDRAPTPFELQAAEHFLSVAFVTIANLGALQEVFAPGNPLRDVRGRDVQVGRYVAPPGGIEVRYALSAIVQCSDTPWRTHVAFEMLHPYMDGNGRTGRMLWAWHMRDRRRDPFSLPFLHRFYYQTLEAQS